MTWDKKRALLERAKEAAAKAQAQVCTYEVWQASGRQEPLSPDGTYRGFELAFLPDRQCFTYSGMDVRGVIVYGFAPSSAALLAGIDALLQEVPCFV